MNQGPNITLQNLIDHATKPAAKERVLDVPLIEGSEVKKRRYITLQDLINYVRGSLYGGEIRFDGNRVATYCYSIEEAKSRGYNQAFFAAGTEFSGQKITVSFPPGMTVTEKDFEDGVRVVCDVYRHGRLIKANQEMAVEFLLLQPMNCNLDVMNYIKDHL